MNKVQVEMVDANKVENGQVHWIDVGFTQLHIVEGKLCIPQHPYTIIRKVLH